MKRKYVKPDLVVESFELSQSIAACGWDMQLSDQNNCHALADPDLVGAAFTLFAEINVQCDVSGREWYCYNPGSWNENMNLWMSYCYNPGSWNENMNLWMS